MLHLPVPVYSRTYQDVSCIFTFIAKALLSILLLWYMSWQNYHFERKC